jgi:hypothetical protein
MAPINSPFWILNSNLVQVASNLLARKRAPKVLYTDRPGIDRMFYVKSIILYCCTNINIKLMAESLSMYVALSPT